MAKNTDREGPIHLAILGYLRAHFPRALIHHSPNANTMQGPQVQRLIAKNKYMGMVPGFPDLLMLHDGICYGFEVKAEGNYQQPNQKDVQALFDTNGGRYFVVRSVEDVAEVLQGEKT